MKSTTNTLTTNAMWRPMRRPMQCPMQLSKTVKCLGQIALTVGLVFMMASNSYAQNKQTQYWQGVLDVGAAKLTMKVEIAKKEAGYSAIVYVVEQGNAKIPVDKIGMTDKKMTWEIDSINASFEGTFDESGEVCAGAFTQHGKAFDLKLNRVNPTEEKADVQVEFWKGTFVPEKGVELEMGIKIFRSTEGELTAKLDSYSQGVTDLPVEFEKKGNTYIVKYPAASLEYSGVLDESKEKLLGTLKQGSSEHKLDFIKTDFGNAPRFDRPQTPRAPFPYESKEVKFENSKQVATLAGTLTVPSGEGPFPVAIMISGSGASDRDESFFGHKPFMVIADDLTRQGIAVLRFDDRGRGESTGEYSGATSADLATDVEAGIEFLKKHPKIDVDKIGLIGHSEGGLIAPMIAAERDDVHFIVLLAGPGVNGGVILKSQSTAMMKAAGESEEKLKANQQIHDAILSLIKKNPKLTSDEIEAASTAYLESVENETTRKLMEPSAKQLVAILKSKWVRFFVQHEPAKTLGKVKCHVLAMNGEKDLQVLCDLNLDPIERALKKSSAASFQVVRLPDMNHMFQETDGSGTPGDYGKIEESFSPKALRIIRDWVKEVTK